MRPLILNFLSATGSSLSPQVSYIFLEEDCKQIVEGPNRLDSYPKEFEGQKIYSIINWSMEVQKHLALVPLDVSSYPWQILIFNIRQNQMVTECVVFYFISTHTQVLVS